MTDMRSVIDDGKGAVTLEIGDPRHGTANGYTNLGCRCELCTDANRRQHARYIDRLRSEGRMVGGHGSTTAYECGCRCAACTRANTRKGRMRRELDKQTERLKQRA